MKETNRNVIGSVIQRRDRYIINLHWYEGEKRKQKWITTGLHVKGNNKRKANELLEAAIEGKQRELDAIAAREHSELPNGRYGNMLFADFLLLWLDACQCKLAKNTYESYSLAVKKQIEPYFREKGITLSELRPADIQKYHATRMKKDNVSGNTVRHHHAYISSALSYAVKNMYISYNPAIGVTLPKRQRYETNFYNAQDVADLLKCVQGTPIETPVLITAYYGLRRSEVLGLRWDAIDFRNNTITIRQKAVYTHDDDGKCVVQMSNSLKTDSSRRTLPIIKPVRDYLIRLQKQQAEDRDRFKGSYKHENTGYLCLMANGELIKPDYLTRNFKKVIDKNGLKQIRFHDLRHSCASIMLANGVPLKEIQLWLGHSDFHTTADIYSHLTFSEKIFAAQKIEEVIGQKIEKQTAKIEKQNEFESPKTA